MQKNQRTSTRLTKLVFNPSKKETYFDIPN